MIGLHVIDNIRYLENIKTVTNILLSNKHDEIRVHVDGYINKKQPDERLLKLLKLFHEVDGDIDKYNQRLISMKLDTLEEHKKDALSKIKEFKSFLDSTIGE